MPSHAIAVAPQLQFLDLTSGDLVAITGPDDVTFLSVLWKINGPGHVRAVLGGTAVQAVLAALSRSGCIQMQVSFQADFVRHASCMVQAPHWDLVRPSLLVVDSDSIWEGAKFTGIDRVIGKSKNLQTLVNAIFSLANQPGCPAQIGRGLITYTPEVPGGIGALLISQDLNAVMLDAATANLARAIGAASDPELGFYAEDSGGGGGGPPTVLIGKYSSAPGLEFAGGHGHTRGDVLPLDRVVSYEPDWRGTFSQFKFDGGSSTHGLPQGFQITGACCYGQTFLVAGRVDNYLGGVYGMDDGLVFSPRSPVNFGINDLFMQQETSTIYVTTEQGCYAGGIGGDLNQWHLVGKYGESCVSVSADGAKVYMVARGQNAGANGLLGYPDSVGGQQAGEGHDGWTMLIPADIITCGAAAGSVYYVRADDPTHVRQYTSGGSRKCGGAGVYAITKIVTVSFPGAGDTELYVLTGGLSKGVYRIKIGHPLLEQVDLPDDVGSVTNVVGTLYGVAFCTANGLRIPGFGGGSDFATQLPNTRVDFAAVGVSFGPSGATPGTRYAANGTAVYDSNSAGEHWRAILDERVSVAAAFIGKTLPVTKGPFAWIAPTAADDGNRYFRYIRTQPPFAPYGNMAIGEVPSAQAGGIFGCLEASTLLREAVERYATYVSRPVQIYDLHSYFYDCRSPLLLTRPTALVPGLHYALEACGIFPPLTVREGNMRIVEHEITVDGSARATTRTRASTTLGTQPYSPEELASAMKYQLSQGQRFR